MQERVFTIAVFVDLVLFPFHLWGFTDTHLCRRFHLSFSLPRVQTAAATAAHSLMMWYRSLEPPSSPAYSSFSVCAWCTNSLWRSPLIAFCFVMSAHQPNLTISSDFVCFWPCIRIPGSYFLNVHQFSLSTFKKYALGYLIPLNKNGHVVIAYYFFQITQLNWSQKEQRYLLSLLVLK